MVFPHFNSTFYGMVQMKFDLDIHYLGGTTKGGEKKGKHARNVKDETLYGGGKI
jgi:hypothetical protein